MFNNLHLYAIILIAVLLIIALAVIYLNNKRITTLTQQLKKNTFELSAMQSVIEGHLMNGGSGALHQDIHMTTTPTNTPTSIPSPTELSRQQTLSNSQYYGDYASNLDGQQYTKSGGPNETESESSSELLDEEDLTDYDEDDDGGADELDDILNNFVEDADDVDINADNASIVDENDIVEVDNTSENILVAEVDDDADIDNSEVVEENIVEDVVVEDSDDEEETEPTADSEPERKTKKKRTPNTSARDHDVGSIVLSENDDNYYTVYETTTGKKRWRKVKDQSSVNADITEVLHSELAPIPEDEPLNVIDIDGTDDATTE